MKSMNDYNKGQNYNPFLDPNYKKKNSSRNFFIVLFIIVLIFLLSGCKDKCDIQTSIQSLETQEALLEARILKYQIKSDELYSDISDLQEQKKELRIQVSGREPTYLVTFSCGYMHDLTNTFVDEYEFDIPVTREFFHSLNKGDVIMKDMNWMEDKEKFVVLTGHKKIQ